MVRRNIAHFDSSFSQSIKKMTRAFKIEIENLYKAFAKYPFKSSITGCSCCVSEKDKETLLSKRFKKLEDKELSRYAFKAMTTWGDVEDFKHYLPRILELTSLKKLHIDTFIILDKLNYGKWRTWKQSEIVAVEKFLKSWWKYEVNTKGYFDLELLFGIKNLIKDLPSLLEDWNLDLHSPGFKNYVDLIENHYYKLMLKDSTFENLSTWETKIFIQWIQKNAHLLEEGFFKFERIDKEFSHRISNTLYAYERIH